MPANGLAVLTNIGDWQNVRIPLLGLAEILHPIIGKGLAKIAGDAHFVSLTQILAPKQQYQMIQPSGAQLSDGAGIKAVRQVQSLDLGAEGG
jgi:hypothetical protein